MTHLDNPTPAQPTVTGLVVDPSSAADWADLAALQRQAEQARRSQQRVRVIAAIVLGTPAALAGLTGRPHIPTPLVLLALAGLLAMLGVLTVIGQVQSWFDASYVLTRAGWRWQITRRWYAPGSIALLDGSLQAPVVVLDWLTDPAFDQPWIVIHRGDDPAQVVPLSHLAPPPDITGGAR